MFNFAYSVSRTSHASSRARSSIFTEEGDIEMDFFSRQVKKIEGNMKETEDKKTELSKEMETEKQTYKAIKSRVRKLREHVETRQSEIRKRKTVVDNFKLTEDDEVERNKQALEAKEEEEALIAKASKSLESKYSQINDIVNSTKSEIGEPNPDRPNLYAATEALKVAVDVRRNIIRENDRHETEIAHKLHELEIREMDLNGQMLNVGEKLDFYDTRKNKSLQELAEPDDNSLDSLEKLVDHLENLANQAELRFSALEDDKVDPDMRRKIVELDRVDSLNLKRRRMLETKYNTIQRELKEINRAIRARAGLSRSSSEVMYVKSKRTPEETEEIVSNRANILREKYLLLAEEVNQIDQLELQNYLEQNRVENDWKNKMKRVENIQDQCLSDDQMVIRINQLNEEIDHSKHLISANESKIEMLQRRAQMAAEEKEKNSQLNPEILNSRDRIERKLLKTNEKAKELERRKEAYAKGANTTDSRESQLADLLQRTKELEEQAKAKGAEIETAKLKMQKEQASLDQALSKVPLDKKIKILENL